MNHKVIDLSHHNIVTDLSAAKAAGVLGIIHKLTDGEMFTDNTAKQHIQMAKDAGLLIGLYHFLRAGDVGKQAAFFLGKAEKLDILDDDTLVAADFERKIPLTDVLHFLQALEKATGRSPVLYSGNFLKDAGGAMACPPIVRFRLWMPQYGPTAVLPKGYDKYWLWQYSETGRVDGIVGDVDLNHFDGSDDELRSEWAGHEPQEAAAEGSQGEL